MIRPEAERLVLARTLLAEVEPDELEFFKEYANAADHKGRGGRLGPEWGISDVASVGPAVVAIGVSLFEVLSSWAGNVPKKIVEGFLVDRGKERLKVWLGSPKKEEIASIVTAKGRVEIMSILSRLVVEAKLPPRDAERLTKKVASHLFGDGPGKR